MPSSSRFKASLSPISRSPRATSPAIRGSPTTVPTTRCRQLSGVTCPPSCPMTIGAARRLARVAGCDSVSNVRVMTTASSAGPDSPSSPRVYVKAPLRVRIAPAFNNPFAVYSRVVMEQSISHDNRRAINPPIRGLTVGHRGYLPLVAADSSSNAFSPRSKARASSFFPLMSITTVRLATLPDCRVVRV